VEFLVVHAARLRGLKQPLFFQTCDPMNNQVYFCGYGNEGIAFAVPSVLRYPFLAPRCSGK
jgi:hypothetical protein